MARVIESSTGYRRDDGVTAEAHGDDTAALCHDQIQVTSPRQEWETAHDAGANHDAWVLATAPRAVAYATALLRTRDRAEDIVQDCYCKLLSKANDYDLQRDGLKLLLKAVSRACLNARTRERRFWTLSVRWGRSGDEQIEIADRSVEEPERHMMYKELAAAIGQGLAELPPKQGAALELKSQGLSLEEIGEILDIKPGHAGVLVHRAREAMKHRLASFLGGQPK